jgi:hypothetical protein
MAARAILIGTLIVLLFPVAVRADDAPKLPSRKASVVLPLLIFSPQDSPKSVLERIDKILGQTAFGESGGGTGNNFWNASYYPLDDKSYIIVGSRKGRLGVAICMPDHSVRDLYVQPKP